MGCLHLSTSGPQFEPYSSGFFAALWRQITSNISPRFSHWSQPKNPHLHTRPAAPMNFKQGHPNSYHSLWHRAELFKSSFWSSLRVNHLDRVNRAGARDAPAPDNRDHATSDTRAEALSARGRLGSDHLHQLCVIILGMMGLC